jgi:4-amino-4-deoxy-L-arabinose transferase-like glycosyltransferase
MKTITPILEKILFFLIILLLVLSAFVFSYYINSQSELDMQELEQIVENELIEIHGKY